MKQRIVSLLALLCLVLSLTACGGEGAAAGGEDAQDEAEPPMTEEEYQSRVEELSTDIGTACPPRMRTPSGKGSRTSAR